MLKKNLRIIALLIALGALIASVKAAPPDPAKPLDSDVQSVTQCPYPDEYEDDGGGERDDSFATASTLTAPGQPGHTFDRWSDKDWAMFAAKEGALYTIATSNLSPPYDPSGFFADTVLELYDTNGIDQLERSDDYGGNYASQIVWVAPADGAYYIQVYNYNPGIYGCDVGYDLLWEETLALEIAKTAEDLNGEPLFADDIIRYTVTITNPSPSQAANNVIVTDYIPNGATYVSGSLTIPPGTLLYPVTDTLIVNMGRLGPSESSNFSFDVSVDSGVTEIGGNVVAVSSDNIPGSQAGPIFPPGGGTVNPGGDVLGINKTAQDLNGAPLQPGDTIEYTLVVWNELDAPQTNVVITDYIPANTTYVADSITSTQGTPSGPDPLVVEVGTLTARATVTASFQVTVNADAGGQEITNQATAGSDQQYPPVSSPPVTPPGGGTVIIPSEQFIYLPIVIRNS